MIRNSAFEAVNTFGGAVRRNQRQRVETGPLEKCRIQVFFVLKNLRKNFKLSDIQAGAILDMPLRRLAALERKKIEEEYKALLKQIRFLQGLLQSPKKILKVVKEELTELKKNYGTPRRTLIVDQTADKDKVVTARDLVPAESVVTTVTQSGRICHWPAEDGLDPARGRQKDPLAVAKATVRKLEVRSLIASATPS